MFPTFSFNNLINICTCDSVNFTEDSSPLRFIKKSYFSYIFFFKLCFWIPFSYTVSFFRHISHIVSVSTKKQMGRSNTKRDVAMMAYAHFFGNFPFMKNPRKTMRTHTISDRKTKRTISIIKFSSYPQPTSWSFFDITPKSYFWINPVEMMESFCRMVLHWKFILSDAIPLDANTSQGFYSKRIISCLYRVV